MENSSFSLFLSTYHLDAATFPFLGFKETPLLLHIVKADIAQI